MPTPSLTKGQPTSHPPPLHSCPQRPAYYLLLSFSTLLAALAFVFNSPQEIWEGSLIILVSPANLVTDYFALANIGATLLNASIMMLFSIGLVALSGAKINGGILASLFTVAGFSLFGKNLYNSMPIILGVVLYCNLARTPLKNTLLPALFGTALAPLVSQITFGLGLPLGTGILLGSLAGFVAGLLLPTLAGHFLSIHHGYNLYNVGFTAGIIGTFFTALLRNFDVVVEPVNLVSSGNNLPFAIILYSMFVLIFVFGLYHNQWSLRGYRDLLGESGRLATDFTACSGFGPTLINMAFCGTIVTSYVLLVGGQLTGPSIGGIFTVLGFSAFGKHVKNLLPVVLGVFVMGILNTYEINSTLAILAALFGTTLAPISGRYGPVAGILAGALHMAMVMNIGYLHAGMNLYNNGFSGGFVAAALVPIFNSFLILTKGGPPELDYEHELEQEH